MDCNLGAEAFASIGKYIKEEAEKGHKLSPAEMQDLFDMRHFPVLSDSKKASDKVAEKFLNAYFYSFNPIDGDKPFIDVEHDLGQKIDDTHDFLNHIAIKDRDIIRNGSVGVIARSVERPLSMALKDTAGGQKYMEKAGLKKYEEVAPLRKIKTTMGVAFTAIIGKEAYDAYKREDYATATSKVAQCTLMVGNSMTPVTKFLGKQAIKIPGVEQGLEKIGVFAETKLVGKVGGHAVPLLGTVIEEGYAVVALGKGAYSAVIDKKGFSSEEWHRAVGDALVCQGGALGSLIPVPGLSFVASESFSEFLAHEYNKGNPECMHVNGSATGTLIRYVDDACKPNPLQGFDRYLDRQYQSLRTHFRVNPPSQQSIFGDDMFFRGLNNLQELTNPYGYPQRPVNPAQLPFPPLNPQADKQQPAPQFRY